MEEKKYYTLEEAQIIGTKIINNRADELFKELKDNKSVKSVNSKSKKIAYV